MPLLLGRCAGTGSISDASGCRAGGLLELLSLASLFLGEAPKKTG